VCLIYTRIEIKDKKLTINVVYNLKSYKYIVCFFKSNLICLLFNILNVSINNNKSITFVDFLLQYSLNVVVNFNLIYIIYCIIVFCTIIYCC